MLRSVDIEPPRRILVVDDEDAVRRPIARLLKRNGYETKEVGDADQAVEAAREWNPALVLLDIGLPGKSGLETIPDLLEIDQDLGIVMLTGNAEASSATNALRLGALDYFTKPTELEDLATGVDRALQRRDTLFQERQIGDWIKREVTKRTRELEESKTRQEKLTLATLEALVAALEAKNPYLGGHSARVAEFAATIAAQLGLPDDDVEEVRVGGWLHDLGMIGIREEVLNKHGQLEPSEYEHVKEHVTIGSRILASLSHLGPVVGFVRSHHERWDGEGYPDGLKEYEIPLGARIIAAAEVYDALTTSRPYQDPVEPNEAVAQMQELAGKLFDPQIVDALEAAVGRRQTLTFYAEDLRPVDNSVGV